MNYSQIKPKKGSDLIMEQIRRRIETGELEPGTRFPSVVELAEQFGVGRSTIREAFSALKAMGLVDIRHGGGTYVLKPEAGASGGARSAEAVFFSGADSLTEVLEVRKYIETGSAALAAKRRTEEDLAALEGILVDMEKHLGDEWESERADIRFHVRIAAASQNTLLAHMMESLTGRMETSMGDTRRIWFYGESASAERLLKEHTAIFEAIRSQDEEASAERMMRHIAKVDEVLRRLM